MSKVWYSENIDEIGLLENNSFSFGQTIGELSTCELTGDSIVSGYVSQIMTIDFDREMLKNNYDVENFLIKNGWHLLGEF